MRLRNLPRTPQHNPWVEHGNGEIKAETGLGKGVRVQDACTAAQDIARALERIDGARPRATRGWKTARKAYADLPRADACVERASFVNDVHCAIREAVQDCETARARRIAEREAILTCMEHAELITRNRGRAPCDNAIEESVS